MGMRTVYSQVPLNIQGICAGVGANVNVKIIHKIKEAI